MNIYKVTRPDECDYDEYDAVVVAAPSESEARLINPSEHITGEWWKNERKVAEWAAPEKLIVELLGSGDIPKGIVLASFNAG